MKKFLSKFIVGTTQTLCVLFAIVTFVDFWFILGGLNAKDGDRISTSLIIFCCGLCSTSIFGVLYLVAKTCAIYLEKNDTETKH